MSTSLARTLSAAAYHMFHRGPVHGLLSTRRGHDVAMSALQVASETDVDLNCVDV